LDDASVTFSRAEKSNEVPVSFSLAEAPGLPTFANTSMNTKRDDGGWQPSQQGPGGRETTHYTYSKIE